MNRIGQSAHQPIADAVSDQHRVSQESDLVTGPQTCALLGISRSTWLRLRKSGVAPAPVDLPGQPRFRRVDIARMVRGGRRFLSSHERLTNQSVSRRVNRSVHAASLVEESNAR
jgi:predicted DNA-binding transcriptional regulator AlpA